jgi:hypothetical protein
MNPKLVVAVLVILVVVFAGTIGVGLTRGDDPGEAHTPGWTERIGESAGLNRRLDPSNDLGASSPSACRGQFIAGELELGAGVGCTFLVRESSSIVPFVRTFTVAVEEGGPARVTVQQPDHVTVKERISAGADPVEFDVYAQGATVRIECQGAIGQSCRVSVDS